MKLLLIITLCWFVADVLALLAFRAIAHHNDR